MWASQEGHVGVVDRLIERGARVDLQKKVKVFQIARTCIQRKCLRRVNVRQK